MTVKEQGKNTRKIILEKIISYITEHGYPPTIREICNMTGIKSTSTIHNHLNKMIESGMLETDSGIGSTRAIRVPGYRFVKEGAE